MEKDIKNSKIEHIYIHIPFCLKKCGYCSFYSTNYNQTLKEKYLSYLKKEIEFYKKNFEILPKTIYFGGGTPSLLNHKEIDEILSLFDLSDTIEITLEANPITLTEKYLKNLKKTKINRISIGTQSMIDNELKLLGRLHNSDKIIQLTKILQKYNFNNFSFDLMYGLPYQKPKNAVYSLKEMIKLEPKHISIYCLSLENSVPMYRLKKFIPTDNSVSQIYFEIIKIAEQNGYKQYEISNFAKPSYESKHNLSYWNDKFYLGFGASAAGYYRNIRYENYSDLNKYFKSIKKIFPNKISLSTKEHIEEFLFLGLRKTEGILISEFIKKFGDSNFEFYKKKLDKYLLSGHLIMDKDRLYLARKSYFISNEIFSDLL